MGGDRFCWKLNGNMTKTICLNMIVKNESKVIKRCLDSIRSLIDSWVIVDTGSTDGTQEFIKNELSGIPGELHEREWVNFSYNRNEAMGLAKGKSDYLLFIDADDHLTFEPNFVLPDLKEALYTILQRDSHFSTHRDHHIFFLVKNDGLVEWRGVVHEYLQSKVLPHRRIELLKGITNVYTSEGCRSQDPKKCVKDCETLKLEIQKDPTDSRNYLYLARTLYSMELFREALPYFQKRSEMGADPMEVYYSLLYMGIIHTKIDSKPEVFLDLFMQAHSFRPSRAEAVYEIARYYTNCEAYSLGLFFAAMALSVPLTKDNLFVESWVQDWGVALYIFLCLRALNRAKEANQIRDMLIANPNFPKNLRDHFKLDEQAAGNF